MATPSIVPVIDQSDSMRSFGYFPAAQTDAATFINIMNIGDSLAIVAFSDTAQVIWPESGQLQVIASQSDQVAATQAIEQLTTINMTNMKSAIDTAYGLVSGAAIPRGIVLLSDGLWNVGGDPIPGLPTDVPIYTIALGPNGQQQVLQQIASDTGGTYNYTPDALGLAEIYNEILGQASVAALLANAQEPVPQYKFKQTYGTVDADMNEVTFGVNWDNQSVVYSSGTPTGEQVNVAVYDPGGNKISVAPIYDGDAFVVFKVPSPQAGQWSVVSWYSGSGTLNTTAGIFQPTSAAMSKIALPPPQSLAAGQLIEVEVHTEGIDSPMVTANIEAPKISLQDARRQHEAALEKIVPNEAFLKEGIDESFAQLLTLHQNRLSENDVFPRESYPLEMKKVSSGIYRGVIENSHIPGSYTVRARAMSNATPVVRGCRGSFVISD